MLIYLMALLTIALVWYYEHQLARLTATIAALLETLDERDDLSSDPPFNLVVTPQHQSKLALVSDSASPRSFSQAEIDDWN